MVLPIFSYRGIDAPGATTSGEVHDEFVPLSDGTVQSLRMGQRLAISQSWDSGADPSEVTGIRIRTYRDNLLGVSGVVRATIYAHSGTFGTSSVPTGSPLVASPWYAAESMPETNAANLFFPLSGWTPDANTDYCVVYEGDIPFGNGAVSEQVAAVIEAAGDATHEGNVALLIASTSPGTWSAQSTQDMAFAVYMQSAGGNVQTYLQHHGWLRTRHAFR